VNKILSKRLDILEQRLIPRVMPYAVFTMHPLQPEQTENLQPGERIVSDHYKQNGLLIYAAQRITSDPKDHGRRCEPEGCLEDVVRRIHEDCYYRTRGGSCHSCHGTPIANT
jgi:hypothetical protein